MATNCLVVGLKAATPDTTVPFPKAQDGPTDVTLTLKIFLPVGLGITEPLVVQPLTTALTAPEFDIVTVVACATVLPLTA